MTTDTGDDTATHPVEKLRGESGVLPGELATTLAHQLNQPLAAILANAQAARRFLESGEIHRDELLQILDDIIRDDKRAGEIVRSLCAGGGNATGC